VRGVVIGLPFLRDAFLTVPLASFTKQNFS
jgi:hypothetical protein